MSACAGLSEFFALVVGACISGLIGFFFSRRARHCDAKDVLTAKIYGIMTLPKDTHFHAKSIEIIRNALWEARPHLNHAAFDSCMSILNEYCQINYYELAEQKQASIAWTLANEMKSVDQRVTEYADRLATEIK